MTADKDLTAIAHEWLSSFASAFAAHDAAAVASTFLPDGWLRDLLTFTWDNRSLEGTQKIAEYVSKSISRVNISKLRLTDDVHFLPALFDAGPGVQGVEFGYTYETDIALGKGIAKILQDANGEWKALTVSMIVVDLKGYEEPPGRQNFEIAAKGRPWGDVEAERKAHIETDPHVLIIGGGQSGLQVAARFARMNISALVIDRNERVGDVWRSRYKSLTLHTTREHHGLLYQNYPSTWPIYTPRDKRANDLEAYAILHDLVVWTKSQPSQRPVYDRETRKWTVVVDHDGTQVTLHPAHIILATGTLGAPYTPTIPDRSRFPGTVIHSTQYNDPADFKGQDVLVIGAGNTAIDICQDLATSGVGSVTMVQRSSSCVTARAYSTSQLERVWVPGVPVEVGDMKFISTPLGFLRKVMIGQGERQWEAEPELNRKLRKAGLKLTMGPEGQGQLLLVFERGGGYWLDKGGADLLESGAIKVKSGAELVSFTEGGLAFSDGTELKADTIIFATGYQNMRIVNRELFGAEVIDKTSPVWGLDEEGEIRGVFRPSGYPGFWYASGDFVRCQSKQLAIFIKALEVGLMDPKDMESIHSANP